MRSNQWGAAFLPGWLLLVAVVLVVMLFLNLRGVSLLQVGGLVRGAEPLPLLGALACHYLVFFFQGLRWRSVVCAGDGPPERPGLLYCCQLALLSCFCNYVFWLRIGETWRVYCYSRERRDRPARVAGAALSGVLYDLFFLSLFLGVMLLQVRWIAPGAAGVVASLSALFFFLFILGLLGVAASGDVAPSIAGAIPWFRGFFESASNAGSDFSMGARSGLSAWLPASFWTFCVWACTLGRTLLVVVSLGALVPVGLSGASSLAGPALSFAPTPGGLGVTEAGMTWLISRAETVPLTVVLAVVLLDRGISYLSVLVVGGAVMLGRLLIPAWRGSPSTDNDPATFFD